MDINLLDLADSFNCPVLKYVATEAVNCIGRINDYAALLKYVSNGLYVPWLRVVRMNMHQHKSG